MDFFQKIGNTLSNTGKDIAKKTKDISDISKLNHEITKNQEAIEKTYSKIGKLYFEKYSEVDNPDLKELCTEIKDANTKIAELKVGITNIKGFTNCPNCNAEVAITAAFCGSCGSKLKEESAIISEESTPIVEGNNSNTENM